MSKIKVARKPRSRRTKVASAVAGAPSTPSEPSAAKRRAMVSEAAYYRAQNRGFEPGRELDDWLAAEAEIAACSLIRDLQPELH